MNSDRSSDSDDVAWSKAHQACFEIAPLIEMRGAQKIQVGFTIDLYARLPVEKAPGTERVEEAQRIQERLRAMVSSLSPERGGNVRVEIEPTRSAAVLRPENEMAPEISVRARVFHGDDYFAAVTEDERARISAVDRRLAALGLRQGHW
jgi:hypothetical protein